MPMNARRLFAVMIALAACQHTVEAQAADKKATPGPHDEALAGAVAPPEATRALADKAAKDAAAKAIAALPACRLQPATGQTTGKLQLVAKNCTALQCIRTCCNACSFAGAIAGDGPQRGLNAGQLRQLFPALAEAPLECEIAAWNSQLNGVTMSVMLPEEKSAEANRAPVKACVQSAER